MGIRNTLQQGEKLTRQALIICRKREESGKMREGGMIEEGIVLSEKREDY